MGFSYNIDKIENHGIIPSQNFNLGRHIVKLAEWFKENPKVFSEWDTEANTHISLDEVGHTSKEKALLWFAQARRGRRLRRPVT